MLRLILLRHADPVATAPNGDHSRPLSPRGPVECASIAKKLASLDWYPELVVTSDAQRTIETWAEVGPLLGSDAKYHETADLYLATRQEIAACLEREASHRCVLAIGHNPGMSDLASRLSGLRISMGTANAALLEAELESWEAIDAVEGMWNLVEFIRP